MKAEGQCGSCNEQWWRENRLAVLIEMNRPKEPDRRTYRESKRERPWGFKGKQSF